MLYAYFSLIFERISVKLGWYIGSITSIKPMNFQVCTLNVMVTVRQNNSSILHTSVHRDNKPRPVQSVSLDVSTKNSVDGPSNATTQSEGRPPWKGFPTGSILVHICYWDMCYYDYTIFVDH